MAHIISIMFGPYQLSLCSSNYDLHPLKKKIQKTFNLQLSLPKRLNHNIWFMNLTYHVNLHYATWASIGRSGILLYQIELYCISLYSFTSYFYILHCITLYCNLLYHFAFYSIISCCMIFYYIICTAMECCNISDTNSIICYEVPSLFLILGKCPSRLIKR